MWSLLQLAMWVVLAVPRGHCAGGVREDVVVDTRYGRVRGFTSDHTRQFLGLPYAQPPTGDLRWRSPREPTPWRGSVYNATMLQPGCPQNDCRWFLRQEECVNTTSEDCLHMNIWTPLSATPTSALPVMVYIHGGAFRWLGGGVPLFDGAYLASRGQIIVVNFDYRLGLLGFLYTGEADDDAHGNYGIQDQRRALQWVQDNICGFGGDPGKVTVFGQSAGAQSVAIHLVSPLSRGLFHSAIVQSSPFDIPYRTKDRARTLGKEVAKLLNCRDGDMKCLRTKSVDDIYNVQIEVAYKPTSVDIFNYLETAAPIVDGSDITIQPVQAAAQDRYRHIPTMVGSVSEEGRLFVYNAWRHNLTKLDYDVAVLALTTSSSGRVKQMYPAPHDPGDLRGLLSQLTTDLLFICPTRNVSRNLVQHSTAPVYRYVFDHAYSIPGAWDNLTFCEGHVCHGSELSYIFHTGKNSTLDEENLSETMIAYWTNFAHTGDPNKGPMPLSLVWPNYDPNNRTILHFQTPSDEVISSYRQEYCDFWDTIGYQT